MNFGKEKTYIVKGIAIILMLMHHLFGNEINFCYEWRVSAFPFNMHALNRFSLYACKVCVAMFVFITAYGITCDYNARQGKQTVLVCLRRYWKLEKKFLIIYILSAATSFLREGGFWTVYASKGTVKGILSIIVDALGFAKYAGTPTLNDTWWYMSLAVTWVFLVPGILALYKKFGSWILCAVPAFIWVQSIMIPRIGFLRIMNNVALNVSLYILTIVLGIWFADKNVFQKLYHVELIQKQKANHALKTGIYLAVFVFALIARMYADGWNWYIWLDAIAAADICALSMMVNAGAPMKFLSFLGRHSMNIFLIHTFIYYYYFPGFIYGFRYWAFILCALLISSLAVSIFIDKIKRVLNIE